MVSLTTANNALKDVYVGVVANQLNINANPLLSQIKRSNKDIWGKEIVKMTTYGINGGIGAGEETGALPMATGNSYAQIRATLKNLYGQLEISDKAIKSSANNIGAFVDLLAYEMEGLVKSSSFNLGRMLYGDGSGKVATISAVDVATKTITCDSVRNIIEGMVLDAFADTTKKSTGAIKVTYVDRTNNKFTFDGDIYAGSELAKDQVLYVQGSKDLEITGLGKLFSTDDTLYGLSKTTYPWLKSYKTDSTEKEISDMLIQEAIDFLEENNDAGINFISCSSKVRRAYQQYLTAYRRNVDIAELAGGFKTITHNGIPVVADRFVEDDAMYLLNTNDFTLHELDDWKWIESEDGSVLRQNAGHATYSATLVKYAELICDKPASQAKICGIKATVTNPFLPNVTVNNIANPQG